MKRIYEQINQQEGHLLSNEQLLSVLFGELGFTVPCRMNYNELNYLAEFEPMEEAIRIKLKAFLQLCENMTRPEESVTVRYPKDVIALPEVQAILRSPQENVLVIFLDPQSHVLGVKKVFTGTFDQTIAHPREVFKEAVKRSASRLICVHNHPCGDTEASDADIHMTRLLVEAGDMIGIPILDHLIVCGGNTYSSMRKDGHFPEKH